MTKPILSAALALALIALPLEAAFAGHGGGGGGGHHGSSGGGGDSSADRGSSERGGFGFDPPRTPDQRRLFDEARRECNGPKYPSGATPRINYDADTFTCFEPGSTRR